MTNSALLFCNSTEETPPVEVVSILYMVIPCLVFGIVFSLVVIFICWRCHKQIIYQAGESAATPLVPVIGKPLVSFRGIFRAWSQLFTANGFCCFYRGFAIKIREKMA